MSSSLPALAFVLASQSLAAAANSVSLREPMFMPARDNGDGDGDDDGDDDDDDGSSTTTEHHTISTSISINQSSSSSSSSSSTTITTHSSSSFFPGSSSSSFPTTSSVPTTSSTITTHSSSTITQSNSNFTTATTGTTGTLTSSSSGYASTTSSTSSSSSGQNTVYGLTSTASHGLSTGTRAGIACGIMFSLILSAVVVCYFRRRSCRPWDQIIDEPAILSSEVGQYWLPDSVASREREVLPPPLPPPQLDIVYPYSPDISHSLPLPAISSAASLLSDDSCIEIYALYLRGAAAAHCRGQQILYE